MHRVFIVAQHEHYGPLAKHHLSKYTVKQLWAAEMEDAWIPEVYNGPYRYVKFDEEAQYLELERNEEWWGNAIYGKPGIKRYAEQANLGLPQFMEGRCDVASFGPVDYERVKDLPDVKIHPRTWFNIGYGLNRMEGRALPRKVMDAIAYAIDRRAWAEELFYGFGQPEDSVFGLRGGQTVSFCPDCDPELYQTREYDPDRSRQLLAEAEAEGIWDPDRVLVILGGGDDMVLLQQQLAAVGIQSELVVGREVVEERRLQGDFDISQAGAWAANNLRNCIAWSWDCEQDYWPQNYHWCNEEFVTLCRDIWTAKDDAQFTEMAERIMEIYWQEGPIWGVTPSVQFYVTTGALGGFVPEESYNWIGTCGDRGVASWYWEK